MEIYYKSIIGSRPTNEDKHMIILNSNESDNTKNNIDMFGIYDGHGGKHVSTLLSEITPQIFMDKRLNFPLKKSTVNKICENIQKILSDDYPSKTRECGSTCCMMFKFKYQDANYINFVNIGDSRSVLCSGNNAIQMTVDHKPLNPSEKNRIHNQGGTIYYDGMEWRVGYLSLSRSFGDTSSKYTQPIPDIFLRKLSSKDKFVIMACDGLWDVIDNQTAVNYVLNYCYDSDGKRNNKKIDIAKKLVEFAKAQGSTDNISAIVIFFN